MKNAMRVFFGALCAILLVITLPQPVAATIVNCGTVATPLACSGSVDTLTLTFNDWSFLSTLSGVGSGTRVQAGDVNISLILDTYSATIRFTPASQATNLASWGPFTGTQLQQMYVGYHVLLSGVGSVNGISSGFTDLFTGTGVGGQNGAGSQTKDVCRGGACDGQGTIVSTVNLNDQTGTPGVQGSYSGATAPPFSLAAGNEFWVRDTVGMQANNQSIQIMQFSNTFEAVPEPGTLALGGVGFVILGLVRRRHRRV